MAREFIYVDEEKTAIKTGEDGMPLFRETIKVGDKEEVTETQADVFHLLDKVPALGNDLKTEKTERKKFQDIVSVLKDKGIKFEAKEDVAGFIDKALESISKVESFNEKDFVGTEKIEEIKTSINATWEERLNDTKGNYEEKIAKLTEEKGNSLGLIKKLMINDQFSSSKFVDERCSAPPQILMNCFASNFDVDLEDLNQSHVVAKYDNGEVIYSKKRVGELPDFDEALSLLIDKSKDRDFFLKASGNSGSGSQSGSNGKGSDFKTEYSEAMKNRDTKTAISLKMNKFKK